MISCKCPAATAITSIPAITCPESFGQIQKVAFQRIFSSGTTKNQFATATKITALASWTAFKAAADSTKIVISPYVEAPTAEAGAARTFGGGNESLNGIEEIIGREPTPFSAVIRRAPQSVIKAIKELQCESAVHNLGVYLFDELGRIGAIKGSGDDDFFPIPVESLFVGDKTLGGLEAPDNNAISWSFKPNWSDDLAIVVPTDFNPLTDL